jgi:hypothetical protein
MARVFQIVATNQQDSHFEKDIVDSGEWHAGISYDAPRTICGIQLEGDDGYAQGPEKSGRVTCQTCRTIIEQVQRIRAWK